MLLFKKKKRTIQEKEEEGMLAAVSIIGGADGPTSVFLAGKLGSFWGIFLTAAAILAAVLIVWRLRKRR